MTKRVLLDLTPLSTAAITRGLGRYLKELTLALHRETRGTSDLQVLGLAKLPLFGQPLISADLPALLETLERPQPVERSRAWAMKVRLSLSRAAARAGVDLVHSPDAGATPWQSLGCARVVTCHLVESEDDEWHGSGGAEGGRAKRRFQGADHVIAISTRTASDLIAHFDLPRGRITVVDNGVDLDAWQPLERFDDEARRSAFAAKRDEYLLCVGGANERKNVAAVMTGLARAAGLRDHGKLTLLWVGQLAATERAYLESVASKAGVSAQVRRLGYVDNADLAALYRGASALVFPSRREGFGYPVLEALATGCPVVTSNRGTTLYVGGDAAISVDPDDTEAIADAIVLLADDATERAKRARLGPVQAARFSAAKMARETILVYDSVQKSSR